MANKKDNLPLFLQALIDVPKCFKGFPKNIMALEDEPIDTVDELKTHRKKLLSFLYLFIAVFVVLNTLGDALISALPGLLGILLTFIFGAFSLVDMGCILYFLYVFCTANTRYKKTTCKKCKSKITYGDNVEILSCHISSGVSTNSTGGITQLVGRRIAGVKIRCKCQECGAEKTFKHSFTLGVETRSHKNLPEGNGMLNAQMYQEIENELKDNRMVGGDSAHVKRLVEEYFK